MKSSCPSNQEFPGELPRPIYDTQKFWKWIWRQSDTHIVTDNTTNEEGELSSIFQSVKLISKTTNEETHQVYSFSFSKMGVSYCFQSKMIFLWMEKWWYGQIPSVVVWNLQVPGLGVLLGRGGYICWYEIKVVLKHNWDRRLNNDWF